MNRGPKPVIRHTDDLESAFAIDGAHRGQNDMVWIIENGRAESERNPVLVTVRFIFRRVKCDFHSN
ncbi:hypothetical protein NI18_15155 [Sphingomonas sp. Ant20]|nr:hypothetical protein NI18_15155 [Sphingomonas sp. Ant20]